jgi:hypothetical protein
VLAEGRSPWRADDHLKRHAIGVQDVFIAETAKRPAAKLAAPIRPGKATPFMSASAGPRAAPHVPAKRSNPSRAPISHAEEDRCSCVASGTSHTHSRLSFQRPAKQTTES